MERAKLYISLISRRFWALEIALRAQKVSALEASQALLNIVAGQMFRYVRSFMYLTLGLLSFFSPMKWGGDSTMQPNFQTM